MAHYLSRPAEELKTQRVFWRAIGMMGLPLMLIFKEPDLGSALVLPERGDVVRGGYAAAVLAQLGGPLAARCFIADVYFLPAGSKWQIKVLGLPAAPSRSISVRIYSAAGCVARGMGTVETTAARLTRTTCGRR